MALDRNNYQEFFPGGGIFSSAKDQKRISRLAGEALVVSTVCPDYPNNGRQYVFDGELGENISLTAQQHLRLIPEFVRQLIRDDDQLSLNWLILVADLPELAAGQEEFFTRVARSKDDYLDRCRKSAEAIQTAVGDQARALTFSDFYGQQKIDYLSIQENTAARILERADSDSAFSGKLTGFMFERKELAEKFRGRPLSRVELRQAAAHGMSLYITHGTLLRRIFQGQNLVVANHFTPNLGNFFLSDFVAGCADLKNTPRFPILILDGDLY